MREKIFKFITVPNFLFLISIILIAVGSAKSIKAKAVMVNSANNVIGSLIFQETHNGVKITGKLKNLPMGIHGIHIHEKGIIDPPEFKAAGGHFNPYNREHGRKNPKGMHAGDLQNITVKKDGSVTINLLAKEVTLEKDKVNSLLKEGGTSIIIHEKPDDYKSNPAGDAGARIAGGVIEENE